MSKITIHITDKGVIFKKGKGQFTIPLNEENDKKPNRRKRIFYVGQEESEKIRPGKTRIRHREKTGTVVGSPVYKKFVNFGFWYADVKWDEGRTETFNLNKMGIEIEL